MEKNNRVYFAGIDITDVTDSQANSNLLFTLDAIIALCNFVGDYSFCWQCPLKHICYGNTTQCQEGKNDTQ